MRSRLALFVLFQAAPSWAQSVVRAGKEWLQPLDFVNLSWNNVAAVCPPPSGACSGFLNGIDVTGYTWATVDDMNALFSSYGIVPPMGPGPDDQGGGINSPWAPLLHSDFDAT